MEGQHLHHHLHQQHQNQMSNDTGDRFPQWSVQETKELLLIRSELDRNFMETKRNKLLWEVIASRMQERNYNRTAEQCKSKWKNLVTRYKASEAMDAEAVRQQFPFFNEMQAIFAARMQRMLWAEAEGGSSKKLLLSMSSEEEEENADSEQEEKVGATKKRKKGKISSSPNVVGSSSVGSSGSGSIREVLEDFMRQQMQIEVQWREAFEAREKERMVKEMEWRQAMEALERERMMMERRWREREEQRRVREEARAEKRDTLITALLHKLRRDDDDNNP